MYDVVPSMRSSIKFPQDVFYNWIVRFLAEHNEISAQGQPIDLKLVAFEILWPNYIIKVSP